MLLDNFVESGRRGAAALKLKSRVGVKKRCPRCHQMYSVSNSYAIHVRKCPGVTSERKQRLDTCACGRPKAMWADVCFGCEQLHPRMAELNLLIAQEKRYGHAREEA